ncbi:MAG: hypothetical protein MMC33_000015 [Icmadophila ericetorum]|nr:hypothetical protein [Icmadophila ericetorum]
MGDLSQFQIGQTVELSDGKTATIRFVGNTHFALGEWLGVELEAPNGKNDGAVQGERYFECKPAHGMFVRPTTAVIIDNQHTPKLAKKTNGNATAPAAQKRLSTMGAKGLQRQSMLDQTVGKRMSLNAGSPTPSSRASRTSNSPSRSPVKQLGSTLSSDNAAPKPAATVATPKPTTMGLKRNSAATRPSMGPPAIPTASRAPRQSIAGTLIGANNSNTARGRPSVSAAQPPTGRPSTIQNGTRRQSVMSGVSQVSGHSRKETSMNSHASGMLSPPIREEQEDEGEDEEEDPEDIISPVLSHDSLPSQSILSPPTLPTSERVLSNASGQTPITSAQLTREIEDLKAKLRIMERKRKEDRDKLMTLEKIQGERDRFENIIQKLQAKYQPQQQEIAVLKKQLREAEAKVQASETAHAEDDTLMEMATLDREMAEETADSLRQELDALRQKHEELELEAEILREENAELGKEMSPEERTSQGWIHMERSNERLREALMRLRDVTQEQEAGLKQQIRELEKDLQDFGNVKAQYESTKERLDQSESTVEDLRQQLDAALGAEEMIEELTEKNMTLTEQIDQFKVAVEDLESLKELNDELEINHMETEKQLQDEIDYQESLLLEQTRKSAIQDETIDDLEYTVSRFRDLVTNLQSDLEDMRASQKITEAEGNDLTSRSRAMIDLNMRLQVSATKAQTKAIDLELRRLEAQESAEQLAIVQNFLPDAFDNERNSVQALLRVRRIGFKSNLMHGLVKEKLNGQAIIGREDETMEGYEVLEKLTWVTTMCTRFAKSIQICDLEAFGRLEGAMYDLEPVERALNGWIDALKQDDLKERQCVTELRRSISLMTHLAEVHISEGLAQQSEDVYMRSTLMQSGLDCALGAVSYIKSIVQSRIPAPEDGHEDESREARVFLQNSDSLISQIRGARVIATKAIHQLEELKSRHLTLQESSLSTIEQSQACVSDLASSTRAFGLSFLGLINQEGRTSPLTYSELIQSLSPGDSSAFSSISSKLNSTTTHLQAFYTLTTTLTQTVEFPDPSEISPPWELLAQKLRAASSTSAFYEQEVGRMKGELQKKNTALAIKDKMLEEMGVSVEVLEKRIGDSGGRREKVRELEIALDSTRSKERELHKRLIGLQQDLQIAETERESLRKQVSQVGAQAGADDLSRAVAGQHQVVSARAQEDTNQLKAEIFSLQATIRHLRQSSHQTSLSSAHSCLSTPLIPKKTPASKENLAREARDVFQTMLTLISRAKNQVVELKSLSREDRLKWRPVRESTGWKLGRQREEWETWKEWRDELCSKVGRLKREEERRQKVEEHKGEVLASLGVHRLPTIGRQEKDSELRQEVRIIKPEEWDRLERELGIA